MVRAIRVRVRVVKEVHVHTVSQDDRSSGKKEKKERKKGDIYQVETCTRNTQIVHRFLPFHVGIACAESCQL